jgi:Cu-Zn family superoxide dismutase
MTITGVAVFNTRSVHGDVVFEKVAGGVKVVAEFTRLPAGEHGFHIHKAGDLRGEGCKGACAHYHVGPAEDHGGPPGSKGGRHTGDLGNISSAKMRYTWTLKGVKAEDMWGRSVIVHADPDDLGLGDAEDSKTTGHSGKRIACAIIGRTMECS